MAAIAPLTLADGQATPVNHTFSPVGKDALGVAKWVDRSSGIAIGYPTVSLLVQEPVRGSTNYKVTRKVVLPVLAVTSPSTSTGIQPAPTKAYELTSIRIDLIPQQAIDSVKKDFYAYCKNFDLHSVNSAAVITQEGVWGG